jgi:hypothetical protein
MSTIAELFTWLYLVPIIFLIAINSWFADDFTPQESSQYKILKFIPLLNIMLGAFMLIAWSKFCIEYIYDKLKKQKNV